MKPLFSYYGGKQRMIKHLLPIAEAIPHTVYTEAFAGGCALLFAKPVKSVAAGLRIEAINDTNGLVSNFYRVARANPSELQHLLDLTCYSQEEYRRAVGVCKANQADPLELAWAFYVNINQSFAHSMGKGWGVSKKGQNGATVWVNRTNRLPEALERIRSVSIGNEDALTFLDRWDSPTALHYCDPPYPNTNQGHYKGYTINDYKNLIDKLDTLKGSFILSNYPQDIAYPDSWQRVEIATVTSAARSKEGSKDRVEVIWYLDRSKAD
jgi:DNA adenine methylase